jgi:DnaJ-class molecular chaperone
MAKNYYVILGVKQSASGGEIKEAYRQRIQEVHPDDYRPEAQPLKEIQHAFHVLSDPRRRSSYDQDQWSGQLRERQKTPTTEPLIPHRRQPAPFASEDLQVDLGRIGLAEAFETYGPSREEVFDRVERNFQTSGHPKSEHLESLVVDIPITPMEAYLGGQACITVPGQVACPACQARGRVGFYECWRCAGHGRLNVEHPIPVSFPAGVPGQYLVQVPLDQFGIGNLYLTVRFRVSQAG